MQAIFSHAARAVIWVGESDTHTESVVRFFASVDKLSSSQRELDVKEKGDGAGMANIKSSSCEAANNEAFVDHEADNFSRIRRFADRPWFHRAWTFQEACLCAAESQILCGNCQLPLSTFVSAVLYFASHGLLAILGQTADTITALAHFSAANPSRHTPYLSIVLPLTRNLQATDPRDKVFSLLGMIDRTNLPPLTLAYALPLSDVYMLAAKAMIVQERGLSVLSGIHGPHHSSQDLPSWVPDWRQPRTTAYLHGYDWPSTTNLYHINKGAKFFNRIKYDPEFDLRILPLRAAKMDIITDICTPKALLDLVAALPSQSSGNHSDTMEIWQEKLGKIIDKIRRSLKNHLLAYAQSGEGIFEALMKTLTVDRGGVGEKGMGQWKTEVSKSSSFLTPSCKWWSDSIHGESDEPDGTLAMKKLASVMWTFLKGRIVFRTEGGLIGVAGKETKLGDEIWNAQGAEIPFIFRAAFDSHKVATSQRKQLTVVGEAYVHGVMKGEMWDTTLVAMNRRKYLKLPGSWSAQGPRMFLGHQLVFEDINLI